MPQKIYILCNFDAEVFCNNKFIFEVFEKNQNPKIIEVENETEINLRFQPFLQNKNVNYLTLTGKISLQTQPKSLCPNFNLLKLNDTSWLLRVYGTTVTNQLCIPIFKDNFSGTSITVYSQKSTNFVVESKDETFQIIIEDAFNKVESHSLKNYQLFKFYENENLKHILLFNLLNGEIIENCKSTLCEFEENTLKILSPLNDMFYHAKVLEYSFQSTTEQNPLINNNFEKVKEYLVYLKHLPKPVLQNKIPFAFLEAINAKNYKLSKNFCDEKLNATMQNEHLELFFENNFEILYFQTDENIVYTIKNNIVNCYAFSLFNNKIFNIDKL